MHKHEAQMLDRNRELNALMRERQAKDIDCKTCGGDGRERVGTNYRQCVSCDGTGLRGVQPKRA